MDASGRRFVRKSVVSLAGRERHRRLRRRFFPSSEALEHRALLAGAPVDPAAMVTIGKFASQRIKSVDGQGQATYSASSTPNQYADWWYWQDNYGQSFGLDGTDKVFADYTQSGFSSFTGGFDAGGSSDTQGQDLYDYNLSADPPTVYIENQFNDWKTLVVFPTSSIDTANGAIYLRVTAAKYGDAGSTVNVNWMPMNSKAFSFTDASKYYNGATNPAGVIKLDGSTSYSIDVSQAISDFLKQPQSGDEIVFVLSTNASGAALSGISAQLLTTPLNPQIDTAAILPSTTGGATLKYHNTGDLPTDNVKIDYFWSTSDQPSALDSTATSERAVQATRDGSRGSGFQEDHLDPSLFVSGPPSWAKYLVARIDPGVPSVNVQYAYLPILRSAPTITFSADPSTPKMKQNYGVYATITNNNWFPMAYKVQWVESFEDPTMKDGAHATIHAGKSGTFTTASALAPFKSMQVALGYPGAPLQFNRAWQIIPESLGKAEESKLIKRMKKVAQKIASKYVPELYKVYEMVKAGHENVKKVDRIVTSVEKELLSPDELATANAGNLHLTAKADFSSSVTPQDNGGAVVYVPGNSIALSVGNSQTSDYKDASTLEVLATQLDELADSPLADVQTKQVLKEGVVAVNMMKSIEQYAQRLKQSAP
jgi:hypothetical protein